MSDLHPDYKKYLDAQVHINESTVKTRRSIISKWPEPKGLTADWFRSLVKKIAPKTALNRKSLVLQILRFLERDDQVKTIKAIKLPKVPDSVTVEDLYTKEELELIFKHTQNPRDRAMLQVLYEGALRAGELLSMTYKNVTFEEDGTATIIIRGKTGTRRVPLFASIPALREYMNHHPVGKGPIWVRNIRPFSPIKWNGLYQVADATIKKADITDKKKLLHMFRHSRITEFVRLGIRGQALHKLVGWTKKSSMEAVYVHLSTADVENEVRSKAFGMETDQERFEPIIKPMKCPRCETVNEPSALYCSKCNMPISVDVIVKALEQQEQKEEDLEKFVQKRVDESMARVIEAFTAAIESLDTESLKNLAVAFAREMRRDPTLTDQE